MPQPGHSWLIKHMVYSSAAHVFLDIVQGKSSAQNNVTKGIIFVCFVFMYLMAYKLV